MDKKKLNLILGAVLLLGAAFFAVTSMTPQQEEPAQTQTQAPTPPPPPQLTSVVVARKDIPKNTLITADEVKQKQTYMHELKPDDYQSIDHVIGKVATVDIIVGEKITRGRVMVKPSEQSLSMKVPEGKRALTIPIDKIASLEGMIKPNDRLDIIGKFAFGQNQSVVVPMFEDILVLAVGRTMAAYAAEGGYTSITVALEPDQGPLLIFALQLGQVQMLLRSPTDSQKSKVKMPVTMETLMATLFNVQQQQIQAVQQQPQQQQAAPAPQTRMPEPEDEIEVYTAGQRR